MSTVRHDVQYALRALRRGPGLTAAVLATLALGIGVNTAIFSFVYGVLLRPLPYPEPDQLVRMWLHNPGQGIERDITSYPNFLGWRERNRTFQQVVAVRGITRNLTGVGEPEELRGEAVTEGYFAMLGLAPERGRVFSPEEAGPDGPEVVVLSHELWATRFGADPSVIGRTIRLSGEAIPVVGVMPARAGDAQFWIPQHFDSASAGLRASWGALWLPIYGRLRPGVSLAQAQADMDAVAKGLEREQPRANQDMGVLLEPLAVTVTGDVRRPLLVLLGAVVLVLLIACANIANLLLARGTGRAREMAVRVALGARRWLLVRQVMTESLVLAVLGGALGLILALWGLNALVAAAPSDLPRLADVRIDGTVLLFTIVASLLAGLLFGAAPAWDVARHDPGRFLAEGGRGDVAGSGKRLRPVLVAGQFALALTLLTGAGLLLRSFANLQRVERGFETEGVLDVALNLPPQRYADDNARRAFYDRLLAAVAALPRVSAAGLTTNLFLSRLPNSTPVTIEGRPDLSPVDANLPIPYDAVSPGFFRMLGMRLVQGRDLARTDGPDEPYVAVVDEAFARRFFRGQDAVGRRFAFGQAQDESDWITVVGIVADARRSGLDQPARPYVYLASTQYSPGRIHLFVKTAGDPLGLVPRVRDAVERIDPEQPLSTVRTLDQALAQSLAARRFVMLLLALFATAALLLAAVGIYGVMAFAVSRRTREIGVRMALGARAAQILRLVISRALRQAAAGLALGIAAALALGRVLRGQLFGISASDPLTIVAAAVLLGAVAVLAAWLPARRAARIDPMQALRME